MCFLLQNPWRQMGDRHPIHPSVISSVYTDKDGWIHSHPLNGTSMAVIPAPCGMSGLSNWRLDPAKMNRRRVSGTTGSGQCRGWTYRSRCSGAARGGLVLMGPQHPRFRRLEGDVWACFWEQRWFGYQDQAIRPSGPAKTTIVIHDMLGYPKLARFLVVGHGAWYFCGSIA